MTVLAAIRPDSWNFPLLLHVLGAMLLVGGLVTAVVAQGLAWRRVSPGDTVAFGRAAFRALLFVALPSWILMRIGGEWIYSKEGWSGDDDPSWLGVGFFTADLGGILLLLTIVLAGLGARRLGRTGGGGGIMLGRVATGLSTLVLLAYLVAVWAMTAKPD
jgi:hypothetical protein